MAADLPKQYDPSAVESEAYRVWQDEKAFHAEPTDPGNPYAIVIPPPNVTAALHLGHALNNTIQDILTRYHRMLGDNAVWLPGTDHAGISTQGIVDRRLQMEGKPALKDYKKMEAAGGNGREQFIAKVQEWKEEYEKKITDQLKAMGCSCDWDRQAFTMDEPRIKAVREAFFQLFKDGLIYRGKRLVNWDPVSLTALADDEVEMEEVDGFFYYLRYPLVGKNGMSDEGGGGISDGVTERRSDGGKGEEASSSSPSSLRASVAPSLISPPGYITVATTRPETMLGDTAVAINPKDPRAAALRGRKVLLPIVNREIPIVEDDYVVLPVSLGGDPADTKAQMATGFLKVTPAHDPNDYEIGRRHNLPVINVMAPDASISEKHGWPADDFAKAEAGFLLGKSREEARKLVVDWFKQNGLLEEMKPYKHSVGHSYRSHVPIEPYLSDQWYCKVTDDRLAGAALRAMAADQRDDSTSRDALTSRDRKGAEPAAQPPVISAQDLSNPKPASRAEGSPSAVAYFITYTTYGTWLHGTDRGSVYRDFNIPGTPTLVGDEQFEMDEFRSLGHPPVTLDQAMRRVVQETIVEVCIHRGWTLHVAHIRPTHVHVVVTANVPPEKVMNDFKAYGTRRIREKGLVDREGRTWTRHGSTRYLNDRESLYAAMDYVHDQQGELLDPAPLVSSDVAARRKALSAATPMGPAGAEPPLPHGRGSLETGLRFYPSRYAKTFQTWHENIRDWCISRQLWWGHRIPVWRSPAGMYGTDPKYRPVTNEYHGTDAARDSYFDNHHEVAIFDESDGWTVYHCVKNLTPETLKSLENAGFTQDPDVLDTWFSSGLWPMSTLGWPEDSALSTQHSALQTWNPSNVLTTAREIITLWVSRMVMFNCYFRNCLPFTDVFIHAMIQDGEGQKMSKTLGNGVDPLDIIESHGADAMRYTLAAMTTHTQDLRMPVDMIDPHTGQTFTPKKITLPNGYVVAAPVQESPKDPKKKMVSSFGYTSGQAKPTADMPLAKNTSSKFDLGRNFCNKIWNAARFVLASVGSASADAKPSNSADISQAQATPQPPSSASAEADPTSIIPMIDLWILSRFNRTVAAIDEALKEYRFDVYASSVYDFFWNDLCAWYLEAVKPAMKDPARAARTANVLASLLDGSLRLMHPMIPFISETIWWKLNEICPTRGVPGRLECPPSPRLVKAAWPKVADVSQAAEHIFPKIQELISSIRQVRNDRQVNPKQVVNVRIASEAERLRSIEMNREIIESLATCKLVELAEKIAPPAGSAKALASGCEVYLEGLVDEAAEKQKNAKRCEELKKQIGAMEGRLNNAAYIAKAPPKLVQESRDQLAALKAEAVQLGCP